MKVSRHVHVPGLQELPESLQKVGLTTDVGGQYHGLDQALQLRQILAGQTGRQPSFSHQGHAGSPMVVF